MLVLYVAEGLIGGLLYRGEIDNFDNELKQGIYYVNGKMETGDNFTQLTSGAPIGAYRFGNLLVLKSIYGTCTTQIYFPISYERYDNQMYWRTSNETNKSKGKWRKETSEQII